MTEAKKPEGTRVTNIEVRGQSFDVYVNNYGTFKATLPDGEQSGSSLDALREAISRKLASTRVKIDVPFYHSDSSAHGSVTGKHVNGNFLVRWESRAKDGKPKTEQMRSLPYNILRPLTPEEVQERAKLVAALHAAQKAVYEFDKPRTLRSLPSLVQEALRKAAGEEATT